MQLYIRPLESPVPRPDKELRAFRKVALAPGEETLVEFSLSRREFEFFDPETKSWRVSPGRYEILTGRHSRSFQLAAVEVL